MLLFVFLYKLFKKVLCLCFKVKVLMGHRVIQVACGSRDAQTLALTDEGISLIALCLRQRAIRKNAQNILMIFELLF